MNGSSTSSAHLKQILSREVKQYLLSDEVFDQYERVLNEFGIETDQATSILSDGFLTLLEQEMTIEQFRERLQDELGLSKEKSVSLLLRLFSRLVPPIAPHVSKLMQEIDAWSEELKSFKYAMSPPEMIDSFLLPFSSGLDRQSIHRLALALTKYLEEERTKEETVDFLQRPPKLGGIEMDLASAQELVKAFDVQRASVDVVHEKPEEVLEQVHVEMGEPEPESEPEKTSVEIFSGESEEDEKEIQQIVAAKQSVLTQASTEKPEGIVARICQNASFVFTDPQLQKRCVEIVDARVREVRDAFQTREALERAVESGGLGVAGRQLADMMERIEQAVDAARMESHRVVAQQRDAENIKKQEAKEQRKQLEEKENQMLAKRYVQTTGKVPTEAVSPVAPTLSRTSLALSSHMQLQQQQSKIDTDKVRAAVEKSTEKKSVPSAPILKPRVQDIRSAPRLAGPIEELQAMGLVEFRRLSKDPQQAIDRMKDIINLLDDQGYERRVEGVRALRSSPLMRAYGLITQKALMSGKSVDDILAQDPQGLKKEEYQALMRLNADLRF